MTSCLLGRGQAQRDDFDAQVVFNTASSRQSSGSFMLRLEPINAILHPWGQQHSLRVDSIT